MSSLNADDIRVLLDDALSATEALMRIKERSRALLRSATDTRAFDLIHDLIVTEHLTEAEITDLIDTLNAWRSAHQTR